MITRNKPRKPANELGFINVRISKKAHREILRQAVEEGRNFYTQLDRILGV